MRYLPAACIVTCADHFAADGAQIWTFCWFAATLARARELSGMQWMPQRSSSIARITYRALCAIAGLVLR